MDISVSLFVCSCVRLRIFPPRTKLAASHFARCFIGVQGMESPISCELCSPWNPKIGRIGERAGHAHDVHNDYPLASEHMTDVRSACMDKCQSHWRKFLFSISLSYRASSDFKNGVDNSRSRCGCDVGLLSSMCLGLGESVLFEKINKFLLLKWRALVNFGWY